MIVIINSWGGLCNQICDLYYSINYFISNNINYTIKNCTFRDENNLENFYFQKYDKLFNINIVNFAKNYIKYDKIKNNVNENNTIYLSSKELSEEKLIEFNYKYKNENKYIFIYNFYRLNVEIKRIFIKFDHLINPNDKILNIYQFIKRNLLPEKYNFIHLRIEKDFEGIFGKENIFNLKCILNKIKFKNDYQIYLACPDINKILNTNVNKNLDFKKKKFIYKDDIIKNINLNFEEKAFIDLLIGKYSQEFYGNNKSSFSLVLSIIKNSNNFYNE